MKRVIFATLYPSFAGRRCELEITKAMLSTSLPDIALSALIASAHKEPLERAQAEFASLNVPIEYVYLPTDYTRRGEEISHGKQELVKLLAQTDADYILFMDADVWTPLEKLPEWIARVSERPARNFIKIKYCLRNRMRSPVRSLGAIFHHRDLLQRTRYWRVVFPKTKKGRRRGAPDCKISACLRRKHCRTIVPKDLFTHHFRNSNDANTYFAGKCYRSRGLRIGDQLRLSAPEIGGQVPSALPVQNSGTAEIAPLVSAVMITGKSPERRPLAAVALKCFLNQDYTNRELVIINDGGVPLASGEPGVREIMVERDPKRTLGDLRNIGSEAAKGQWIIQWDDDDWHAPSRISLQMRGARKDRANLLRRQIRYSLVSNAGRVWIIRRGIPGTLLYYKNDALRYPSVRRGEDTRFLRKFKGRRVLDNPASAYVRFYHGNNTWGEGHIMGGLTGRRNSLALSDPEKTLFVNSILPDYFVQEARGTVNGKLFGGPLNWSCAPWIGMQRRPKILGIGLSKMGSGNLARALSRIGISSARCPRCVHDVERNDAAVGVSTTCYYRELVSLFPGSLVVVLNRAKDDWLADCENHWKSNTGRVSPFFLKIRCSLFGSSTYSREEFSRAYDEFQTTSLTWLKTQGVPTLVVNVHDAQWETALDRFLRENGWRTIGCK